MKMYLVIENSCELNKQLAINTGCDMSQSTRIFRCYGWGLEVSNVSMLPAEYHGKLKGFDYLTDEQKADVNDNI